MAGSLGLVCLGFLQLISITGARGGSLLDCIHSAHNFYTERLRPSRVEVPHYRDLAQHRNCGIARVSTTKQSKQAQTLLAQPIHCCRSIVLAKRAYIGCHSSSTKTAQFYCCLNN
jgi:hypothetical protein